MTLYHRTKIIGKLVNCLKFKTTIHYVKMRVIATKNMVLPYSYH